MRHLICTLHNSESESRTLLQTTPQQSLFSKWHCNWSEPLHTWPRNGIAQPHSWDVYCCAESGVLQQTPYPHWWGFRDFMSRLHHKTAGIRMRERKLCPKCVGCSSCLLLWFTYLYKCTRKNLFAQQWLHMLFPVSIDGIHKWISLCDTAAIGK